MIFEYEGTDQHGAVVQGTIDASCPEDALVEIRKLGHFPLRIREIGESERIGNTLATIGGAMLVLLLLYLVFWRQ